MSACEILVSGGTGNIGRELLSILTEAGIPVRLLVRKNSRSELPDNNLIEIVRCDTDDTENLSTVMDGIKLIYLLNRDQPALAKMECDFISIAKNAGVEKIVKSSAFAAGLVPPVGYGIPHAEAENYLMSSGLRWIVLRPYMFMQNFLEMTALIHSPGILPLPMGSARIALIDARDVALVASTILLDSAYDNKSYTLTGPDSLTMNDCARILSTQCEHKVRYVSPPMWLAGILMSKDGVSKWDVRMRKQLFSMIRDGGEESVSQDVHNITGKSPRSFPEFVQDYSREFSPD